MANFQFQSFSVSKVRQSTSRRVFLFGYSSSQLVTRFFRVVVLTKRMPSLSLHSSFDGGNFEPIMMDDDEDAGESFSARLNKKISKSSKKGF